ncbi:hypothetical protein [Tenacibaculum sp. 190524A02b]|uniref:hypothetical protein n=1 Tax=Tenacibaculum vairaonense TaxID=3137860 RepID=UPI0031FB24C9
MRKIIPVFLLTLNFLNCTNYGQLKVITQVPDKLEEVSGITKVKGSDLLWMHNDSGNKAEVYGVDIEGNIQQKIKLEVKNKDWEDVTTDEEGNLYIADFGNNDNKRKNLVIYKVQNQEVLKGGKVSAEKIKFKYDNQEKFPPKKKERFFDAESILYYNNALYIFTKSRVKNSFGKTSLYKIPAQSGNYTATYIGTFETCMKDMHCWITSASISPNKNKVALLNHNKLLVFTNFEGDNFFEGELTEYDLKHTSQKEGVTFKDNTTVYITDEKAHGSGGNLYEFVLK